MPEALRGCFGTLDADVGHGPSDLPVGGRPRSRPEGLAGSLRLRRAHRVDELEGEDRLGRNWDLAPAPGAALQGPYPGGLEVDVDGADGQGLGDVSDDMRQGECKSLVGRLRCPGGDFEEAPALIGGEVLAAAGIDELEVAIRRDNSFSVVSAMSPDLGPAPKLLLGGYMNSLGSAHCAPSTAAYEIGIGHQAGGGRILALTQQSIHVWCQA